MSNATQRGTANRSAHDPRIAALRIVDGVLTGKDTSQALLDKLLQESNLVPSDKRLCTELVYGYLRLRLRLDWDLARFLRNPEKLPHEMRLILGLAAYELAYLRIPAHASVNWAVARVRNRFGQGLAGVANASLRAFAKMAAKYEDVSRYDAIPDDAERLAVVHAVPAWVVRMWIGAYGLDTALRYLKASSGQAVSAVRVNARREDAASVRNTLLTEGKGVAVASFGVAFPEGAPYVAKTFERKGRVSFQSAAVQELLEELGAFSWKGSVWDACAGRGGKTAALLERGVALAAATDISPKRIAGLRRELERLSLPVPFVAEADAANPSVCPPFAAKADAPDFPVPGVPFSGEPAPGEPVLNVSIPSVPALNSPFSGSPAHSPFCDKFAFILADVPCSGLGTLSRRPEIRFRRTADDIADLVKVQDAILDAAAGNLLPDGRIAYITCTVNPVENEERVKAFLTRHSSFMFEKEWSTPPDSPWREFFYGAVLKNMGPRPF